MSLFFSRHLDCTLDQLEAFAEKELGTELSNYCKNPEIATATETV
jgi:hypothetical protein